jgi:glycosyltransferase involved in cell wall biosynthesis
MNIGLLTTSFPRHDHDIAGSFVLGFARALSDRGHAVEVLAPEPRERVRPLGVHGVTVRHVPYLRPRGLQRTFYGAGVPDNLARDPLAWLGLAPFCASLLHSARERAPHWQAVVSHWALPCALAASAARSDIPHIAVLHSADIHVLSRLPARSQLAARIALGADVLWFVTQAQRARFLRLLPKHVPLPRTLVCPMGVTTPAAPIFSTREREQFRRSHQLQGFCVLLLGRLVSIKGVDVAIRAAAMGGMTLLIAGDGPLRAELMRLATQLRVPIKWLGVILGKDKERWLSAADALALPSRRLPGGRSEGAPCAVLEALTYGLPVVASRLDGIAELFEDGDPSYDLVPQDDPRALHAALLALRDDTSHTADARPRPLVSHRYGWQHVGTRISELLDDALYARKIDTGQPTARSLR